MIREENLPEVPLVHYFWNQMVMQLTSYALGRSAFSGYGMTNDGERVDEDIYDFKFFFNDDINPPVLTLRLHIYTGKVEVLVGEFVGRLIESKVHDESEEHSYMFDSWQKPKLTNKSKLVLEVERIMGSYKGD